MTQKAISWLTIAAVGFSAGTAVAAGTSFATPFVTRAEATMLLIQARVPEVPRSFINDFPDVKPGAWYENYVIAGVRLGLLQPDPVSKKLRPEEPVTRAEFVTMAVTMFNIDATNFTSTYADVPANAWYAPGAAVAQGYKLFPKDTDPKRFHGNVFLTHADVATAVKILTEADASARNDALAKPAASWYQMISTSMRRILFRHAAAPLRPITTITQPMVLLLPRPAPAGSAPEQIPALRREVLTLVNEIRDRAALPILSVHPALETSAQLYAKEMHDGGFFGHESPGGKTLSDRMRQSGYYNPFFIERYLLGENLAKGQRTATEVVSHWMESPSHRQAILNGTFTDAGVGVSAGVWVMHFGGKQN